MKTMTLWRLIPLRLLLPGAAIFSGCATKPKAPKTYTFFPPSPDDPRIQYLTAFASDADLGRGRTFEDYITGERKND